MSAHWLLYSYDALGLGHARRMLSIARAVLPERPDLAALLVTCSPQLDALPIPAGLDTLKLPSARKLSPQTYVSRSLRLDPDRLQSLRASVIADAVRQFAPELFLVDKSPCGLMGELAPALEELHAAPATRPRLVLGWRDILDSPERIAAEWSAKRTRHWVERWYDEVWVYGDPTLYDMRVEYRMPAAFADRIRFVGYLAPRADASAIAAARQRLGTGRVALVCAGGGEDGEASIAAWLQAVHRGLLPSDLRSVVITGPMMPLDAQRRLRAEAPASVSVEPFAPGLEPLIGAADLVVGMAGYNTVCEVLGAGTPAVFVPRADQRDEQRIRASRLAARGLAEAVEPASLSPESIARAACAALERGPRRTMPLLDLGGLAAVARHISRLLPAAPTRAAGGLAR